MDIGEFKATLTKDSLPADLNDLLSALWYEARGDWARAHKLAQQQNDEFGFWIHAYLHRVEGDQGNADYWYRKAGREPSRLPLAQEWEEIAAALL